ncbi:MAG: class I SAM-dependent methyltransferase [Methylococcales bacterium]
MSKNRFDNRVTNELYWNRVWSARGQRLDQLRESDFYYGRNGLISRLIRARVGNIAGRSVLEFGGGGANYRLLAMAKWLGAETTALDFSEEGLSVLRRLFAMNGCEGSSIHADICTWTARQPCDMVVHWGVLEHFLDPLPILEKSAHALKPGGDLLFSVPNMEAMAAVLWKKWSPENWSKHVFHSTDLIESTLRRVGFGEIRSFYFGVPFFKTIEWERRSFAQVPVDLLQKIGSASARVFPMYHRLGHRLISMERGFCARKPL